MKLIKLYYSIRNAGDGSAYLKWFLTKEDAQYDQDHLDEGWGETCLGEIDSYEGSAQHTEAIEGSVNLVMKKKLKIGMKVLVDGEVKTITGITNYEDAIDIAEPPNYVYFKDIVIEEIT